MTIKFQGEKYIFEIVIQNSSQDVGFFIRATDKFTGRTSCINNLNIILSELNVDIDNPKFDDSSWVVTQKEARRFEKMAKQLLSSSSFLVYLERRLDEDRNLGEWENVIPI